MKEKRRICTKCKVLKGKTSFNLRPDGKLRSWCKRCTNQVLLQYRKDNPERRKPSNKRRAKRYAMNNPAKIKARLITKKAIKSGVISKLPCEVCGDVKSQVHHPNYSKPLKIMWLCWKHHMEIHNNKK